MSKLRVGIIFGGRSAEHEVSLQSARNIVDALDRSRFEPILIGIDKAGHWQLISGSKPVPMGFYATRISTRAAWIDSVLNQPYRPISPVLLPRPGRPQ